MVRRWRGRLECVFQAQAEADPWSEHLAARAAEARLRHRGVLDELKSLIGAGALDFAEAAGRLTAEGDCNLQAMLSIAHDHMTQEYGTAPGRYAVFALGKFGGAEMTLGSDLDLLFVYEPLNEEAAVLAADYFGRLAQRLTQLLVTAPDWRVAYEVDFRLRPHGADGPLATSLSGLRHYLQTEAWPWEMQALTRLRPVAGCERLSAEVAALAVQSIALRCAALDPKAEVSEMRALLQAEKPASHDWDLKQRPGGMVDIEFIAQALQLVSAQGRASTCWRHGACCRLCVSSRPCSTSRTSASSRARRRRPCAGCWTSRPPP
jgi:glutamine synthetase adenylyltransferase